MTDTINYQLELQLNRNILWQYEDAVNLIGLIGKKSEFYDLALTQFSKDWFTNVFNLKTADLFGCIVWGIILNIPIIAYAPPVGTPFGFEPDRGNFDNSNFVYLTQSGIVLTTDEYRRLLRLQYYKQTINPSIGNINYMLKDVFGDLGKAWVVEGLYGQPVPFKGRFGLGKFRGNFNGSNFHNKVITGVEPMTQTYMINFNLSSDFIGTLVAHDVLPRGSGVRSVIVRVP